MVLSNKDEITEECIQLQTDTNIPETTHSLGLGVTLPTSSADDLLNVCCTLLATGADTCKMSDGVNIYRHISQTASRLYTEMTTVLPGCLHLCVITVVSARDARRQHSLCPWQHYLQVVTSLLLASR